MPHHGHSIDRWDDATGSKVRNVSMTLEHLVL